MPLTLSHPAAVLPFRRLGLPTSVLVVGSMVPDVPLFLGWPEGYSRAHSIAGVVTVDLAATLLVVVLWFALARDALVDMSPVWIRSRLPARARLTARQWVLAPIAACLGAATHIAWDAFTHPHRWGVGQLGWLQADHGGLPGYKWAQYVSGVLGLLVVGLAVVSHLRGGPPPRALTTRAPRALTTGLLPLVVLIAALAGLVAAWSKVPAGFHAMAFTGVVHTIIALVVGLALACTTWQVMVRTRAA